MPLLTLPPEILWIVLQFVGADEFCEQLDRLLVCKRWHWFAQRIILEELQLSAKALKHFPPASVRLRRLLQAPQPPLYPARRLRRLGFSQAPRRCSVYWVWGRAELCG